MGFFSKILKLPIITKDKSTKMALCYMQLAEHHQKYSDNSFLNNYYVATGNAAFMMVDFLWDGKCVKKYMKTMDEAQTLLLVKLCGSSIMAMFLANDEYRRLLEHVHYNVADFKGGLTGCMKYNVKDLEVFNKMCSLGSDYSKMTFYFSECFYTYVMGTGVVLDLSKRIMINQAFIFGNQVFNDKFHKLLTSAQ